MLRFVSVTRESLERPDGTVVVSRDAIYSDLDAARKGSNAEAILVYDADLIPGDGSSSVKLTISDARNGVPYRTPLSVTAAGGYVVRSRSEEGSKSAGAPDKDPCSAHWREDTDLLLIFRRGVWDLPKGKLHEGESIEEAAIREVMEEVGVDNLSIVAPLGTTVHGYTEGERYTVKTTHWFLMETTSEDFAPQESEQIEEVRWVDWDRAQEMLGYDTLRDHMKSIGSG